MSDADPTLEDFEAAWEDYPEFFGWDVDMNRRTEMEKRHRELAGPIRDLAMNNPVVGHVVDAYVHGTILTKEEALYQMVVLLARDWSAAMENNFKMAMAFPQQIMVTPPEKKSA